LLFVVLRLVLIGNGIAFLSIANLPVRQGARASVCRERICVCGGAGQDAGALTLRVLAGLNGIDGDIRRIQARRCINTIMGSAPIAFPIAPGHD
jgi:hypothetical protein